MSKFFIITFSVMIIFSENIIQHISADVTVATFHEELFGSGHFKISDVREGAVTKHLSSSTEDLLILFEAEKNIINSLKTNFSTFNHETKEAYLKSVDFDENQDPAEYVYHPINAFHMLQRTTKWLPKLKKLLPELKLEFSLPSSTDANVGAANGLADLQEFHGIDPSELINGQITNYVTGNQYFSKSKLSSNEALKIATAARDSKYLESFVGWCKAALQSAKSEKKDKKVISSIKKLIQQGKDVHDETFMKMKFDEAIGHAGRLREKPYLSTSLTKKQEGIFAHKTEVMNSRFDNLLKEGSQQFVGNDLPNRFDLLLRRRTQKLCTGTFERHPILEAQLKCLWLSHKDPYLKLGPFKLELMHTNPEIAVIHNFATPNELQKIKDGARGHMKSTPYVMGEKENSYSKLRTSKVMYMNEKLVPMAMTLSKKITLATRYHMKKEKYASENFQVMNYGIGGRISGHLDSTGGHVEQSSEHSDFGGLRVTTFMIYMSHVEAGGHTVFPQAGVSVQPVEGKALFWFNVGSQGTYDSRIYHLGCPVLHGNKWISNKWVKLLPQFKNYPCLIKNKYYFTTKV